MSTRRQLRARLDRLDRLDRPAAKTASLGNCPFEFPIDPVLAKAIRDDHDRLLELTKERLFSRNPLNSKDEERILQARIAERAKKISCPSCYGFKERWEDSRRLELLGENGFNMDSPRGHPELPLYSVKDVQAERTQLIARIEAFDHNPEGRARIRIEELIGRNWQLTLENFDELEQLLSLYPEPWCYQNDIMYHVLQAGTKNPRLTEILARYRGQTSLDRASRS